MKKPDLFYILYLLLIFAPFFLSEDLFNSYNEFNRNHGFIMAFIKFAVLATSGELLGLRIRTGRYLHDDFGIILRALIWGFLGVLIKCAFSIFSSGVPSLLEYFGMENPLALLRSDFSAGKLMVAFCISFFMNLFFSPVLMTLHRITDTQITLSKGSLAGFVRKMDVIKILGETDWATHWGFVIKKTIPIFWLPAHTITFLLPTDYQVLFAALLGIILGVILAFASANKVDK